MGDRYAALARRLFLRHRREVSPRLPTDRRRLVAAVEQALRGRSRRRARARWLTSGAVVVAAAAAALVLVPRLRSAGGGATVAQGSGTPVAVAGSPAPAADAHALRVISAADEGEPARAAMDASGCGSRPIVRGMALQAGIQLLAPESGEVQIGTAEGTALTLERGGDVRVSEVGATMRFALARGAVRAHVAKLRAGERFIIETDDAEIEVHGTTFRVSLAAVDATCGGGVRTRVSVDEGVVTVSARGGGAVAQIGAGRQWPEGCAVSVGGGRAPSLRALANDGQVARRGGTGRAAGAARADKLGSADEPAGLPPSELAAQNDLFAAAIRAARGDDVSEALQLFTSFAKRYPDSPLFEHALAQRMKLLAATDSRGAADAATEYLSRFPTGFARLEARALVGRAQP